MNNKYIIGVLILAIFLVGTYLTVNSTSAVVSAQGSSVLKVIPDRVSVNINIEARNETAQKAKNAHDKIMDDLTVSLLKIGIDKNDIKTINFNIYPEYDWEEGKQEQKGYIATQQVIVETEDFDMVAGIVDASIDAGALVSYINFELSEQKQNEYKAKALEEAGKDAKIKAEATVRGLGKKIGSLVSVKNQEFDYGPVIYYEGDAVPSGVAAKDAALRISPKDIEVRAAIQVEYKVRPF